MSIRVLLLFACVPVGLAGCSIGRPLPATTQYVIDVSTDAAPTPDRRGTETLRVGVAHVAPAFAGSALMYRLGDVRYASDPYHAFLTDPGAILAGRVADSLERAGIFGAVTRAGIAGPARYVIEIAVMELYGDFRPVQSPAAVLAMQFAVIDQSGTRPVLTYQRSISQRIDLPEASPEALVRGYGAALSRILTQLSSELGAQVRAGM